MTGMDFFMSVLFSKNGSAGSFVSWINRAIRGMGTGQVTGAHQEFVYDFAAGEFEGLFEQAGPFFPRFGVVVFDPVPE